MESAPVFTLVAVGVINACAPHPPKRRTAKMKADFMRFPNKRNPEGVNENHRVPGLRTGVTSGNLGEYRRVTKRFRSFPILKGFNA